MKEKQKGQNESKLGGGSFFGSSADPKDKQVSVASGPYCETLPVAGMTVGEVRKKFSQQLEIDEQSQPIINGNPGKEDDVLKPGENLMFVRHAGEKGGAKVTLENNLAVATISEGDTATCSIGHLLEAASPGGRMNTGDVMLPVGVKGVRSQGNMTVWVWEQPPKIHQLSWIRSDSPAPYGPSAKYRKVRIALPYLIILGTFNVGGNGMPQTALVDECFFRTAPLRTWDDELSYPGLLNCSKFASEQPGNPLAWICTQHLKRTKQMSSRNPGERFCGCFEAVRYCLLETSFNLSSEHHEGNSWYGASKLVDPRIATIEDWEENTKKDPLFVLDVPWIKTKRSVSQVVDRIFAKSCCADAKVTTASQLARIVFEA